MAPKHACPGCSGASIPIFYGLPAYELFEAAERGEVALGGCEITDEPARRQCVGCGLQF